MSDFFWRASIVIAIVVILATLVAAAWVSLLIDEGDEHGQP